MLAKMSLSIIPESLAKEPIVIAIDDTTIAKFGKKFADVQYMYDHSIHDSKNHMVNGHCFVSLTMSVPVMETRKGYQQQIRYVPISIGYAMWTPEKSKLELTSLSRPIFLAVWLIVPKLPKIPISSWSSWQLWAGIRVMQHKSCKVL